MLCCHSDTPQNSTVIIKATRPYVFIHTFHISPMTFVMLRVGFNNIGATSGIIHNMSALKSYMQRQFTTIHRRKRHSLPDLSSEIYTASAYRALDENRNAVLGIKPLYCSLVISQMLNAS